MPRLRNCRHYWVSLCFRIDRRVLTRDLFGLRVSHACQISRLENLTSKHVLAKNSA